MGIFLKEKEISSKSSNLPLIKLDSKATLKITNQFNYLVKYLCNEINTVEWSGLLFFKTEGDINSQDEVVITPIDIYPMDKGSSGYTEYDIDEKVFDYYENHPDRFGMKYGHIHSHHNMDAFFSGTDMSEIRDNTVNHSYYVSVIVNNHGKIVAKIGIPGKRKIKGDYIYSFSGFLGSLINIPRKTDKEENVIYVIDMNVEIEEGYGDELFYKRVKEIKKPVYKEDVQQLSIFSDNGYSRPSNIVLPEREDYDDLPIPKIFKECLGGTTHEDIPEVFANIIGCDDEMNSKEDIQFFIEQCLDVESVIEFIKEYQRDVNAQPDSKTILKVYKRFRGIANYYINGEFGSLAKMILKVIEEQEKEVMFYG